MAAVAAVMLGVISLPSMLFPRLLFIPVVGIGLATFALRTLRRRRNELTGRGLAIAGMAISVFSLVGGAAIATTVYVTEVPEGYHRISFEQLQPDKHNPGLPVSEAALELNGQKVFIKGYIYPADRTSELKRFILVPDMGTCCFGGQPKLTDMIEVTLRDPHRARFSFQRRKIGGVLQVDTQLKEINGLTGVYYQLDADYIR
jgi:hypothetical protein